MGICYCPTQELLTEIQKENLERFRDYYPEYKKYYMTQTDLREDRVSHKYFHEYLDEYSLSNMVDKILLWGNSKERYFEIKELFNEYDLWEGVSLPYLYGKKVTTHFLMKVAAIISVDGYVSILHPHVEHLSRVYREIIRLLPFHKIYEKISPKGFSRIFTKGRVRSEFNAIKDKILNWLWFPIKEMKAVLGYKKMKGFWANPAVEHEIRDYKKPFNLNNLVLLRYEWEIHPFWQARFDPNYRSLVSDIRENDNLSLLKSREIDLMIAYQKITRYFDSWDSLSDTTKKIIRCFFGTFTGKRQEFNLDKLLKREAPNYERELLLSNTFHFQMCTTRQVLEWADYINNLSGL